jgi:polyisoprenoid-binding protein YceI
MDYDEMHDRLLPNQGVLRYAKRSTIERTPNSQAIGGFIGMIAEEMPLYKIRPSNESTLRLEIFRKGLLAGERHILFFDSYSGEIRYDEQDPERSDMRFVVESRSCACKDKWLTRKQREKVVSYTLRKMLAAVRFPEIEFTSTGITKQASHQYAVRGDLTIRGITRPTFIEVAAKQIGEERLEFDGEAIVRMKDYGMEPPTSVLGFAGTKNKMRLRFLFWAERINAQSAPAPRQILGNDDQSDSSCGIGETRPQ